MRISDNRKSVETVLFIDTYLTLFYFQEDKGIRDRVRLSLGLLVGAKLLNVSVPFLLKYAIDDLNAHHTAAHGGEALLSLATASDTILTVTTSLLIGCEYIQLFIEYPSRQVDN